MFQQYFNINNSRMQLLHQTKIENNLNSTLQIYQSVQLPTILKSKQLKIDKYDKMEQIKLNKNKLDQSTKISSKSPFFQKDLQKKKDKSKIKDLQSFLDHKINYKQFCFPIRSVKKNNLIYPDIKSYSSRQSRQLNSSRIDDKKVIESQLFSSICGEQKNINKSNFNLQYIVGKGGFGKVWKVKEKKSGKNYAMKQMLKSKIIKKKSIGSVINEKKLLQKLNHPFLVNMKYSFQDTNNLYLVLDYVNCGDLRYHLCNRQRFTERQTKFFIACIIIALEYLHSQKIIHRDVKPENLVIDDKGYVRLTDLGVSKQCKKNNSSDTSGTPGYMSPQVICKTQHSYGADFFAVGVIGYEFMIGKRPYLGRNRQQIRQNMLSKQVKIQETPIGWTSEAVDFVNRLIIRKPQNRLGVNGAAELKNHAWFKNFDWAALQSKKIKAPFLPLSIEADYQNFKYCISSDTKITDDQEMNLVLKNQYIQQLFQGYECNNIKKQAKSRRSSFSKKKYIEVI